MKIIEKEFNAQTGEEIITERDETDVEKKEREKFAAELKEAKIKADAKAAQRQAIAERLGLSSEELSLLLGGK